MDVKALGHVVLKVRNLQRSEDFYSGILGMRVILRLCDPRMTFLSLETTENHHDFALMELGPVAPAPAGDATGLAHVAFKVGSSLEEFGLARSLLDESGTRSCTRRSVAFPGACMFSIRTETKLGFTSTSRATDQSGPRNVRG